MIESTGALFLNGDLGIVQSIIESCHDGVYIADAKGYYVTANEAFERITGINRKEMANKHTLYMLEKNWITTAVNLEVLKDHRSRTKLIRYPNGKEILVTASVVLNNNNEVIGVVSTLRDLTELNKMHEELLQQQVLVEEYRKWVDFLQDKLTSNTSDFIVRSTEGKRVLAFAEKVARTDATVLITGESGVGKEVIAKYIHERSERGKTGSFTKVDCAALPATLLESELFGYEKGAFTNARKEGKPGMFEVANRGTLFLDEIGELPLDLQAKILNAVQNREIKRIGGLSPISVDVRIISATNRNLEDMVRERKFREDLYYRLNVIPLYIPPLRERKEDIVPLINYYLNHYNKLYNLSKYLSREVLDLMVDYDWPGNVRSLRNTIERLVVMSSNDLIVIHDLPEEIKNFKPSAGASEKTKTRYNYEGPEEKVQRVGNLKKMLEMREKELIEIALQIHGNLTAAAHDLGIDLSTLTRKNRKYGLKGVTRKN